jgi:DNA-directed RNA polymerase subunit E'/Rpb7
MIPPDMKFDAQASPPQWTNNEDQVVEKGVNVRIRIRAVKVQIDKLTAIGTINEVSFSKSYFNSMHWANQIFTGLPWVRETLY